MTIRVSIAAAILSFCVATSRAELPKLEAAEMNSAVFMETMALPSSGEFFTAVDKQFEPNWTKILRPSVPVTTAQREHLALQVGVLLADCHVAIEAQDGQAAKNLGRDILNLAKKLSVSQNVLARGQNISDLADKGEWRTLREELDAMQNDIRLSMQDQNDYDILVFLMIGSWVRQMEIASALLIQNPDPDATELLKQPVILQHLLERLGGMTEKSRANPLAETIRTRLETLKPHMAKDTPVADDSISYIAATMATLLNASAEPPPKP